jgi:hypothetical protein
MSNIGEQFHTLVIDSVEGDVTPEEISEIAANTIERLRGGQDPVEIGVLYADALPGEKGNLFFEEPLAPGRYVMLCYVIDEETGQPHYELGMVEEFTVE